jgi:tetratricopeptide (TPR) repeat protein
VQREAPAGAVGPAVQREAPAGAGGPAVQAKALAGASVLEWERGHHDRSTVLAERALELYRGLGDGPGMVRALANLGYAAGAAGDLARARAHYEECLTVARAAGRERDVGIALGCLTDLSLRERSLDRAKRLGEEALAVARDQESRGVAQTNLGYVAIHDGRAADARALLRAAAETFSALGDAEVVSLALAGLAAVAASPEAAARLLGAADAHRVPAMAPDAFEPEVRERAARDARERLGDGAFEAAFAAGRALTLEQALELSRGS